MFATVDLHNLMSFLRLRDHSHAQYEIRQYAQALGKLAMTVAPVTMGHFLKMREGK
jgi:thymidylate synthase (FAD)